MAVMPCHFLAHDGNYTEQSRRDSTRLVVSLLLPVDRRRGRWFPRSLTKRGDAPEISRHSSDSLRLSFHDGESDRRRIYDPYFTSPLRRDRSSMFISQLQTQRLKIKIELFVFHENMSFIFESTRIWDRARASFRSFALYLGMLR